MRTREGMKVAKAKGRLRGKAPKLSAAQETHLVGLYRAGQHTTAELAAVATGLYLLRLHQPKGLACRAGLAGTVRAVRLPAEAGDCPGPVPPAGLAR